MGPMNTTRASLTTLGKWLPVRAFFIVRIDAFLIRTQRTPRDVLLPSHWIQQVANSDRLSNADLVEQKGPEIRTGLTKEGKDVRQSITSSCCY